jgi:hypothetical protein
VPVHDTVRDITYPHSPCLGSGRCWSAWQQGSWQDPRRHTSPQGTRAGGQSPVVCARPAALQVYKIINHIVVVVVVVAVAAIIFIVLVIIIPAAALA